MKRLIALALMIVLINPSGMAALAGDALYAGGTIAQFNGAKERVKGRIDISGADQLVFTTDDVLNAAHPLRIDYQAIQDLEFGQKAGRRLAISTGATVLLGPIGLLSLLSKRRAHYLTVGYLDDHGGNQVAVFELGKSVVRDTLAAVEARSGIAIDQDEDARKWSR
jgi:hypothetical protein